jgi:hypothetical protein
MDYRANILEGSRTNEVELKEIIGTNENTLLKFTEDNQIIGCVVSRKEQQLYLGMLTVSPMLQNSGIGKIITTGRSSCSGGLH